MTPAGLQNLKLLSRDRFALENVTCIFLDKSPVGGNVLGCTDEIPDDPLNRLLEWQGHFRTEIAGDPQRQVAPHPRDLRDRRRRLPPRGGVEPCPPLPHRPDLLPARHRPPPYSPP